MPHIESVAADAGIQALVTSPDLGRLGLANCHAVPDKLRALRQLGGGYDLVIVHRDADRETTEARRREIAAAVEAEWPDHPHIAVVPVRALEAWLLLDEQAIRRVAENPNGKMPLQLPRGTAAERIADPKKLLQETLAEASGAHGRRMATFRSRFPRHRHKLLESLDPFGPVNRLPSWQNFISDLKAALRSSAG
ncbi:DUF4276 family protein [Streptomyces sp. UH6]|uniref:DUF4276 family protein n=1 Tax=Streptomyces sp. UH6 TaxID=2748379 RepID=UPI00280BCC08|nr:DUF4276 family protein [Streptomyces sp. UH6]